jgi:hypothetical protein
VNRHKDWWKRIKYLEINPAIRFFTKESKMYIGEKTATSTHDAGKTGYWHAEYWNKIPVFHAVSVNS